MRCTSDDPSTHDGDTCPIHDDPSGACNALREDVLNILDTLERIKNENTHHPLTLQVLEDTLVLLGQAEYRLSWLRYTAGFPGLSQSDQNFAASVHRSFIS